MATQIALPHRGERWTTWLRQFALFLGILMSGGNLLFPRLPLLVAVLVLTMFLKNPLLLLRGGLSWIWLLLVAVLAVSLIGSGQIDVGPVAIRYANFFAGLTLLGLYLDLPRNTLSDDLEPMLKLMAIQAYLTVILAALFSGFFVPYKYNLAVYNTIGFVFTYHDSIDATSIIQRPDGFFYEPGVYQIYLNILLYISLFVRNNYRIAALAAGAVILTQSTTGIAITLTIAAFAYYQRFRTAKYREKMIVAVLGPVIMLPLLIIAANNYLDKTEGASRGSSWARQYDLYTGLRIVAEYPLTGIGLDPERYTELAQDFGYLETELELGSALERTNSNGLVGLAYTLGIPLFLVFIFGIIRQRFFPYSLAFTLFFIIAYIGEALALTPFFLMITFSGLVRTGRARAPVAVPLGQPVRNAVDRDAGAT